MMIKILFLASIGAIAAHYLKNTPEDLKQYFAYIDNEARELQHQAALQIAGQMFEVYSATGDARAVIEQNLTDAATPYWENITSLEEAAAEKGQNISVCVDIGNVQLYEMNSSITFQAYAAFEYYNYSGIRIANSSFTQAYSVILEAQVLSDVVYACNDDTCATELKTMVMEYSERIKTVLANAQTITNNYLNSYLPRILPLYVFNIDLYVTRYTDFLNQVIDCINNLG